MLLVWPLSSPCAPGNGPVQYRCHRSAQSTEIVNRVGVVQGERLWAGNPGFTWLMALLLPMHVLFLLQGG